MIRLSLPLTAVSLFVAVGCGTSLPPPELVQARSTYDRASHGPAQELAPAELDTAKLPAVRPIPVDDLVHCGPPWFRISLHAERSCQRAAITS